MQVHRSNIPSPSLQRDHQILAQVLYYLVANFALVVEMLRQALHQHHLFLGREASNRCLQDTADTGLVLCNEALIVHEAEESHDELAVHAVRHSTMSRNRVSKVLDVERAFEAGCKESTKGRDERCERGQNDNVELHGRHCQSAWQEVPAMWDEWQRVSVGNEDWVRFTLQSSEDIGAEVVDRTDEVLGSHKDIGEEEAQEDGADPCTDESCKVGEISMRCMIGTSIMDAPQRLHPRSSPSTVFLGLSLMSCVLPKVIPQIYAKMSLMITRLTGRKNQIMPSKMLFMIKCA